MFFTFSLCFAFIFRNTFGYFVPNLFSYGILFNYQNIPHTYEFSPVIVQVPNDVYPALQGKHLWSNFLNDRSFETTLNGPSPVIFQAPNDVYPMQGKHLGSNFPNDRSFETTLNGLSPVIFQASNDVYPALQGKHLGSNFLNDRSFETPINGLSPVKVQDSGGESILEIDDKLEGRQFGLNYLNNRLFKKVKTTLDVTFNKEKENPLVVKCRENFEGTLVNNECYKFFNEELKWNEARHFCKDKGGAKADLWTPDPMDAFLYQKLSYLMPEFGKASYDLLWMGAKFDHDGERIFDLNKEDITDTFQMNINEFHPVGDSGTEDECILLSFYLGGFVAVSGGCDHRDNDFNFICEFPLDEDSKKGFSMKKKKVVIRLFKN